LALQRVHQVQLDPEGLPDLAYLENRGILQVRAVLALEQVRNDLLQVEECKYQDEIFRKRNHENLEANFLRSRN
jgi:hypothetical protein